MGATPLTLLSLDWLQKPLGSARIDTLSQQLCQYFRQAATSFVGVLAMDTSSQTAPSQKTVIVGAGPAGLLLAHYLLTRHYTVEIYDRRPHPRTVAPEQSRSFPISLQERGRQALQNIPGLEDAIAHHSIFCQGTVPSQKRHARYSATKQGHDH